jgi:penicillin-binding protein 1A
MNNVTGGTLPARVWHDIMLTAHQGKPAKALPGTRSPWVEEAASRLPWNTPDGSSEQAPLYRRMFGILSGGGG